MCKRDVAISLYFIKCLFLSHLKVVKIKIHLHSTSQPRGYSSNREHVQHCLSFLWNIVPVLGLGLGCATVQHAVLMLNHTQGIKTETEEESTFWTCFGNCCVNYSRQLLKMHLVQRKICR